MIFQCNFTEATLESIIPNNSNISLWFDALSSTLPVYNITTKNRVAAFIAQTCMESYDYTLFQENLNYSAARLLQVYPTHFTVTTAAQYQHQPEKIANHVYASRFGNGNEASGDGWTYSGKGAIQVTFKDNYISCSQFLYKDDRLVQNPNLLLEPTDALNSAIWFWQSHNLSELADVNNFAGITEKINGGLGDEPQRLAYYNKLLAIL